MGFIDSVREARAHRAQAKAVRDYKAQVDRWDAHCDRAARLYRIAKDPTLAQVANLPIALAAGEVPLLGGAGFSLIAPRNQLVRDWVGTSYRLSDKTTVRAGHSTMYATVDQPTPIDQGWVVITNQRAVFLGRTRSVEWPFRRTIGITHDPSGRWTAIHVTSRQRLNGFGYPVSLADNVEFALALGMAMWEGRRQEFVDDLVLQAGDLFRNPPAAPHGVRVDPRVRKAAMPPESIAAAQQAPLTSATPPPQLDPVRPSHATTEPEPAPDRTAVLGFSNTRLAVVAVVLERHGFVVARVVPDPATRTPADLDAAMRALAQQHGKAWAAVIQGDADFVASYLDGLESADLRAVCDPIEVLDDLSVDDTETLVIEPLVAGYVASAPDAVTTSLRADGSRVHMFRLDAVLGDDDIAVANAAGQIERWLHPGSQAAVVTGPASSFDEFRQHLTAFETVAYCGTPADVAALGIAVADQPAGALEVDEAPTVAGTDPITVAGRVVANPLAIVVRFLVDHPGTITNYDLAAGTSDAVTTAVIRATRRPWMNSRISATEEAWFIDRARTAPWDTVPADAQLRDADPTVTGGLYDRMSDLYDHFSTAAPARVGLAKISKVLHFMRPGLYPILDSHVAAAYEQPARGAARDVAAARPEFARFRVLRWEAIRRDLIASDAALGQLRGALRSADVPYAADVAGKVGDVRLLDILAWGDAPDDDAEDLDQA